MLLGVIVWSEKDGEARVVWDMPTIKRTPWVVVMDSIKDCIDNLDKTYNKVFSYPGDTWPRAFKASEKA